MKRWKVWYENYTDCLFNDKVVLKTQDLKEIINKIALSSNDDKRLQIFDKPITYPYETNAFKICKSGVLSKYNWSILMIMQMKTKQNII